MSEADCFGLENEGLGLPDPEDTRVDCLGERRFPSTDSQRITGSFVEDDERILVVSETRSLMAGLEAGEEPRSFEKAGARETLYFDPAETTCGIVTCGGLCPGINNVIRAITLTAHHAYGVKRILGFRYGYEGLSAASTVEPIDLTPDVVDHIHTRGGTILGTSRGPQDRDEMVDTLLKHGVNILFAIGGDGTLRGAGDIADKIRERGESIAVIGVPKTIDNDISWIARSFGFMTSVEEARAVIDAAHTEARGALNGIGIVKLMGRHSGFIAAHATLASSDVNFCLVPEVPFALDGEGGLLRALEKRLAARRHAVIALAEGAGQDLLEGAAGRDESGNLKLKDIGLFLRSLIEAYFDERNIEYAIKYIDPSYTIRGLPAGAMDAEFCLSLGQHAVHAGMAGKTSMVVGLWNQFFTHVPIRLVTSKRNTIDPRGMNWQRVMQATGQGRFLAG